MNKNEFNIGDQVVFKQPDKVIFLFSAGNPNAGSVFVVTGFIGGVEIILCDSSKNTVWTVEKEIKKI